MLEENELIHTKTQKNIENPVIRAVTKDYMGNILFAGGVGTPVILVLRKQDGIGGAMPTWAIQ